MTDSESNELSDLIRSAMPDRAISNFIAICEVMTENGMELEIITSQSITPWLGMGMLQSALSTLQGTEDIFIFTSDDDEENE